MRCEKWESKIRSWKLEIWMFLFHCSQENQRNDELDSHLKIYLWMFINVVNAFLYAVSLKVRAVSSVINIKGADIFQTFSLNEVKLYSSCNSVKHRGSSRNLLKQINWNLFWNIFLFLLKWIIKQNFVKTCLQIVLTK